MKITTWQCGGRTYRGGNAKRDACRYAQRLAKKGIYFTGLRRKIRHSAR